ncbi:MAG: CDP-alcohol phosphatidyltransferase family protein [Deferribacterota bacterium]|nr:CDP-alcohol phosphatidyltransferase family protein [Deferribacterota bacterium]
MLKAYIINGLDINIWGLTPYERIAKVLEKKKDIQLIKKLDSLKDDDEIVLFNGDYIFDERIIDYIINNKNICIKTKESRNEHIVAIHGVGINAKNYYYSIKENDIKHLPDNIKIIDLKDIITNTFRTSLRKVDRPYLLNVKNTPRKYIENKIYYGTYKGVTDIITRVVWPKPAKLAVKFCVSRGITPNEVTTLSLILALIAGLLFYFNLYTLGLVLGWFMTFLDTVDGKLARATISYSRFGYRYDHAIDLVHPIYWYLCWGLSLDALNTPMEAVWFALWIIIIFYIIGRILEGGFKLFLKTSFHIYCWRPFDSILRLFIARRNPNLIILTISAVFSAYTIGLYLVSLWTLISAIILLIRFILAIKEKKREGKLTSWLDNIDTEMINKKRIYKLFIYD